jgi:hypothetical protein
MCNVEMRVARIGVDVIETAFNPPEPYRQYRADLYECPICSHQVAAGFGQSLRRPDWPDDAIIAYESIDHAMQNVPIKKKGE